MQVVSILHDGNRMIASCFFDSKTILNKTGISLKDAIFRWSTVPL
jgi:hypothetical protein